MQANIKTAWTNKLCDAAGFLQGETVMFNCCLITRFVALGFPPLFSSLADKGGAIWVD